MICEHCKQRHATVTITQIKNGTKLERHYCEICAGKFHPFQVEIQEEPVSIHQLMSDWFSLPKWKSKVQEETQPKKQQGTCPSCGFTYRQFLKVGKFGCAQCYHTFRDQLPQVLKRLQADVKHIGKKQTEEYQFINYQKQIELIRQQMQQAIAEERFEDAARLRDEVRAIEQKLHVGGGETS
ncbi:UvrB/UvrC motif-containing protein [Lysinibacillus sp. KU-BSD001]|uniref:UvrB/UvrC motif-containing protein n=1 Tax=Lysinibacillus sp. KU-BSD001 TaxID=3141328 RepID=UPI0036E150C3